MTDQVKVPDPVIDNSAYINLLSQNLPVVGKLYSGDLPTAAKNLEAAISKTLGKSVAGMIWNDVAQKFTTSTDDIVSALNLLVKYQENKSNKTAENIDITARINRYAKYFLELSK